MYTSLIELYRAGTISRESFCTKWAMLQHKDYSLKAIGTKNNLVYVYRGRQARVINNQLEWYEFEKKYTAKSFKEYKRRCDLNSALLVVKR